jgi:subtilisin family serine protease
VQVKPQQRPNLSGVQVDAGLHNASGPTALMLELNDEPAVLTYNRANTATASKAAILATTRAQISRIESAQQKVVAQLAALQLNDKVLYRVANVYNGIALIADASRIQDLTKLAGVKAVHLLPTYDRSNAASVPLIGSPTAWASYGITGTNVKIGIIDTGIDYLHTNFGGPGTGYDVYTDTTSLAVTGAAGVFPSAKVVGGYDFAGDGYKAGVTAPTPDPNPLDCAASKGGGHGSHVSGTAAGYGVNADGTTYRGPYDNTVPFDTMRIGPGNAPGAQLYGLRVFGCTGSTNLVVQAVNYAIDPNGDSNFADHLDVINLSLGSSFGNDGTNNPDVVAINNAASVGVVPVISAGNSGDVYYIAGSPGSATRAVTVASSVDSTDVVDGFLVNSPAGIAGTYPASFSANYNWAASPAITGNVIYPLALADQSGCTAFSPAAAAVIAGNVVMLDWVPTGSSTFPCGSATRANNAKAAGAIGAILVDNQSVFSTSIAGNTTLPEIFTNKPTGDTIKGQLTPGVVSTISVTLDGTLANSGKIVIPGRVDTVSTFTSRGPRVGDSALKPDVAAPGQTIFSTASGTGNKGETLSGTSMAAPQVTGVMALLREKNPTWTVEELKALLMNTANFDLYSGLTQAAPPIFSVGRVGTGRVNAAGAITGTVIAYSNDNPGAVSISFGAVEVNGTATQTRTVHVSNKSNSAVTYNLSYSPDYTMPGVNYSFPDGSQVTVPANSSATFRVQLTATASSMTNASDPTTTSTQFGLPRSYLDEASGLIVFTPTGAGQKLYLAVHAVVRPASAMGTMQTGLDFTASNSTVITLTGQGVNTGSSYPTDNVSLVSAFELQGVSPALTDTTVADADLKYVGISSDAPTWLAASQPITKGNVYFAIATQGNWSTPATQSEYDVYVDTNNDGVDDYVFYNARVQNTATQTYSDVFLSEGGPIANPTTLQDFINGEDAGTLNTALYNSNVMILSVPIAALGITDPANARIKYHVNAFDYTTSSVVDQAGPFSYDLANPGLNVTANYTGVTLYNDLPNNSIPITYNQVAYKANASQGLLLLHHFNTNGNRAQVVPLTLTPTVQVQAAPTTSMYGQSVTVTSTVTGSGPTPTGSITLQDGVSGPVLTTGNLVNGQFVYSTSSLSAGTHTLVATYSGDNNYVTGSNTVSVIVIPAATTPTTPVATTTTPVATTTTPVPTTTTPVVTSTTYTYNLPFLANNYTAPGGTGAFTTFLAFQNTGSASANVTIQYYDASGNPISASTVVTSVAKYGELIGANPLVLGNRGAGVITSDQPLAVIVAEATPYGGSAYAVNAGSNNTLNAPFAFNNTFGGYTTQLTVFNAGSSPVTATVNFYDNTGTVASSASQSFSVGAKQSYTLDQGAVSSNIATGFNGWAQVSSAAGSQLVAQVLEQNPGIRYVSIVNAAAGSSSTAYAPAIFNQAYGSFVTGADIINPNSTPVTVTVNYYTLTGTLYAASPFSLAGHALASVYHGGVGAGNGVAGTGLPVGFAGAASISAPGGGVVVAVNEFGGYTSAGTTESGTYSAASSGSSVVGLPVIANNGFGYTTGTTIFNTSSQTVTGTLQYYDLSGTAVGTAQQMSISPNGSAAYYQGSASQGLSSGFYGVAVITQTGGPANSLLDTTNAVSASFFYTYVEPTQ